MILEVLSDKKVRPADTVVDAARKAFDEKADLSATALGISCRRRSRTSSFAP